MYREYSRALRGEKAYGVVSGRKYKRISIVAGKCEDKMLAPMSYEGTTDRVLFEYWFENALLPELKAGQTVILDNATIHNKNKIRELANHAGCSVIFLPPYSPDLNSIEKFWSWLNNKMRSMLRCFDSFYEALYDCFKLE